MASRRHIRIALIAALAFACAAAAFVLRLRRERPVNFWIAQPGLSVSERCYIIQKMGRLLDQWRDTRDELYVPYGEAPAPYDVYLVVNLNQRAMWIERDERLWDGWRVDLPEKLDWSIHRQFVGGTETLGPVARLKIRGWSTRPEMPEYVHIVGRVRHGGHVALSVSPSGGGWTNSSGPFRLTALPAPKRPRDPEEPRYTSMVVSDREYREAMESARAAAATGGGEAVPTPEAGLLARQRADWDRVEAKLYREVERQVRRRGLKLTDLKVCPGPDFHAGHAELEARRGGLTSLLHDRPASGEALNFDRLGVGVWYVSSVTHPLRRKPSGLDLEFLVYAGESLPGSEEDWLARGRQVLGQPSLPPSPWNVVLPNGTTVEFIGVCNAPSLGKQWWGPDGSPLEGAPYISTSTSPILRPGSLFEIAWRVIRPRPRSGGHESVTLSGSTGGGYQAGEDRHGWRPEDYLRYQQYQFPEGRETTTVRMGVSVDDGEMDWVEFRNVSLVPGKDFGFEMAPSTGPAR